MKTRADLENLATEIYWQVERGRIGIGADLLSDLVRDALHEAADVARNAVASMATTKDTDVAGGEDARFALEPHLLDQWINAFGEKPPSFAKAWSWGQVERELGCNVLANVVPTRVRIKPDLFATLWTDSSSRPWIVTDAHGNQITPPAK